MSKETEVEASPTPEVPRPRVKWSKFELVSTTSAEEELESIKSGSSKGGGDDGDAGDISSFETSRHRVKNDQVDDEEEDDDDFGELDTLESVLLREEGAGFAQSGGGGGGGHVGQGIGRKLNLSARVQNEITSSEKKGEKRASHQGRDDRATSEQVLDPRTRLILFKLLNSGYLNEIDGCLSTGKEANVYYAKAGPKAGAGGVDDQGEDREFAVKIFKTSILVFKDRDRYVSGEYRFRNGYCKSNPRKMVKTWAEKEMRNLKRLWAAGIPCPEPRLLKSHVLVMDFLGKDGWCAPRLKDAPLEDEEVLECYVTIVVDVYRMYHECNLVHGDLSEYNLLWHQGRAVIIDVSQSVEHSHPYANDFLRKDLSNVTDFFRKKGLNTLSNYELFLFVTDPDVKVTNGRLQDECTRPPTQRESGSVLAPAELEQQKRHVGELKAVLHALLERAADKADKIDEQEARAEEEEAFAALARIHADARKKAAGNGNNVAGNVGGKVMSMDALDEESSVSSSTDTSSLYPSPGLGLGLSTVGHGASEESLIEDAVFLQAFIPTSLSDLAQPHLEMARLNGARGGREPIYAAAVQRMLGGGTNNGLAGRGRRDLDSEGVSGDGDDDSDSDDSDGDSTDNSKEGGEGRGSDGGEGGADSRDRGGQDGGKYRKVLPPRDDVEARAAEKDARREARKAAKAEAALRRQTKIPKHVKKRAVKSGKTNK